MVGFDRDRDEQRVFRLSRIVGEVAADGPAGSVTVPDGVDVRRIAFDWGDPVSEPRPGGGAAAARRGAGHAAVGPGRAPGRRSGVGRGVGRGGPDVPRRGPVRAVPGAVRR
ncbi:hypothetical protein LUX32_04890 [Actinomadura madurae]|nr:hypothetical protein [Actinomadura madurae]